VTTEQDLEIIRLNLRLQILRSLIGNILVALSSMRPEIGRIVLNGYAVNAAPELFLRGVTAAQSDMISSEQREAIEEMREYLRSILGA